MKRPFTTVDSGVISSPCRSRVWDNFGTVRETGKPTHISLIRNDPTSVSHGRGHWFEPSTAHHLIKYLRGFIAGSQGGTAASTSNAGDTGKIAAPED